MSCVIRHVSHVICHIKFVCCCFVFVDKSVMLVVGGSAINRASPYSFSVRTLFGMYNLDPGHLKIGIISLSQRHTDKQDLRRGKKACCN